MDGNIMLLLFLFAFMLMMFFSSRRRRKLATKIDESLVPGAKVMTAGGMLGEVISVDDRIVRLKIAQGEIEVIRPAIQRVFEAEVADEPANQVIDAPAVAATETEVNLDKAAAADVSKTVEVKPESATNISDADPKVRQP